MRKHASSFYASRSSSVVSLVAFGPNIRKNTKNPFVQWLESILCGVSSIQKRLHCTLARHNGNLQNCGILTTVCRMLLGVPCFKFYFHAALLSALWPMLNFCLVRKLQLSLNLAAPLLLVLTTFRFVTAHGPLPWARCVFSTIKSFLTTRVDNKWALCASSKHKH